MLEFVNVRPLSHQLERHESLRRCTASRMYRERRPSLRRTAERSQHSRARYWRRPAAGRCASPTLRFLRRLTLNVQVDATSPHAIFTDEVFLSRIATNVRRPPHAGKPRLTACTAPLKRPEILQSPRLRLPSRLLRRSNPLHRRLRFRHRHQCEIPTSSLPALYAGRLFAHSASCRHRSRSSDIEAARRTAEGHDHGRIERRRRDDFYRQIADRARSASSPVDRARTSAERISSTIGGRLFGSCDFGRRFGDLEEKRVGSERGRCGRGCWGV